MIYKKETLQKRFVSGRYTPIVLTVAALLLWLVGCIPGLGGQSDWGEHALSLLFYAASAFILNSFMIIEGRTTWLAGLFLWLCAIGLTFDGDSLVAASLFVYMLSLVMLFRCSQGEGVQLRVYAAFALLGVSSLLIVQSLYLLPLFLLYIVMASLFSVRTLFAAILGFLTPCWLLWGTLYVLPWLCPQGLSVMPSVHGLLHMPHWSLSLHSTAFPAMELFVMIPAAVLFLKTPGRGKLFMRRMFLFMLLANIYLWLLAWFAEHNSGMLLAWRIPGLAVMAAYMFTSGMNRVTGIYFVLLNILWILIFLIELWNWVG